MQPVLGPFALCHRYGQTEPPTIPVDELFEEGAFPEGEILDHPRDFNSFRVSDVTLLYSLYLVVPVSAFLFC